MAKYIINGGQKLSGEVSIRGAKNASFKQIIASMLSSEPSWLSNIPQISDVKITQSIARHTGSQIQKIGQHSLKIQTSKIINSTIPSGTGRQSRTSFMFIAPLLLRTGHITFPTPGGDKLGKRPLDRLYTCLAKMNIQIEHKKDSTSLHSQHVTATEYTFPKPSHTVTEVLLMLASMAEGQSIFHNSAIEPEIDDLIELLNQMGAKIHRQNTDPSTIVVQGVSQLHGTEHQVIADRNEAVTFACATLATKGSINILRIEPQHIQTFLDTIQNMGATVNRGRDEVEIIWTKTLRSVKVETEPQPGFMTDWQAIFSVLLTQATGASSIIEKIFPQRFQHIKILNQMGAKTKFFNPQIENTTNYYHFNPESDHPSFFHGVKIYGPTKLKPINLDIKDLRAGATATVAALTANGQSIINNVEYIKRGYENLAPRLRSLGADIRYLKN